MKDYRVLFLFLFVLTSVTTTITTEPSPKQSPIRIEYLSLNLNPPPSQKKSREIPPFSSALSIQTDNPEELTLRIDHTEEDKKVDSITQQLLLRRLHLLLQKGLFSPPKR